MSGQHDQGKSPNGGEREKEKGRNVAQEVGATAIIVHGKADQHAKEDGFWTTRPSTGRKSKLFGIHGIPDSQEEKEEDLAFTLSKGEQSDEDMEKAAPHWPDHKDWAGAMRLLNASPTPARRSAQPASKKRCFDALSSTPVRPRMIGVGRDRMITAGISALHAATKEIIQQGKDAEVRAMAKGKRGEEKAKAHEQGVTSVINSIATIQSDLGATVARGATIENMLNTVGTAIEQGASGTGEQLGNLGATVSGAAMEIGWLKARIEALERVAEQSRLESGAAKETAREVLRAVEELDRKRTAEALTEAKRRDVVEQTIANGMEASLVFFGKQIEELVKEVGKKEEEMRKEMEEKLKEEKEDFLEMTRQLRKAVEEANKREIPPPPSWSDEMEDNEMRIPEISLTPAEAVDVAAQITAAVERARTEQRAGSKEAAGWQGQRDPETGAGAEGEGNPDPNVPRESTPEAPKGPSAEGEPDRIEARSSGVRY